MDKVSGRSLGSGWGSAESRTRDCHLVLPPCAHHTPPVPAAGDRDPALGHQHRWDGDPESPFPSAAPLCGSATTALPLLLQLLHHPAPCARHSQNIQLIPPTQPIILHPPLPSPSRDAHTSCTPSTTTASPICPEDARPAPCLIPLPGTTPCTEPATKPTPQSRSLLHHPKESTTRSRWHPPAIPMPLSGCTHGSNLFGNITLGAGMQPGACLDSPQPSTCSQREPNQGHPAAIALFFHSSITRLEQGARREVRE